MQRIPFCLKRTFHIPPDGADTTRGDVLLCELSQYHVCTAVAHTASRAMQQVSYYELKNGLVPNALRNILEAEKGASGAIKGVVLSNALKETVLVPSHHFTEESATQLHANLYESEKEPLVFDSVNEYDLVVVHQVPGALLQELKGANETRILHSYTCQLRTCVDAADTITVHFTGKEIRVVATREGQLKQAQIWHYSTPLDVVYYLLLLCRQYHFSQSDTTLVLSGLVSQDSAMYKELYQYFSNIRFWKPAVKPILQSEYPPHFFSSLYNLAACAL